MRNPFYNSKIEIILDSLHLQFTIASLISRSGKPVLKKNIKQAAAEAEKRSPCLLLCRRIRRLLHASLAAVRQVSKYVPKYCCYGIATYYENLKRQHKIALEFLVF